MRQIKTTWILILLLSCFILVACGSVNEESYKLPIAKYEPNPHILSGNFNIHLEFFNEDKEDGYATIVIHKFNESLLDLPQDSVISFWINELDIQGKGQLDILTTINHEHLNTELAQQLVENEEEITVTVEWGENIFEEIELMYRTPTLPSH